MLIKKVFVIIVTYNGAAWIDKNLSALQASSYPVHIIVVDNNSTDDSLTLLQQYPEVDIITSPQNLGFGKANTIAMKKALQQTADYIFLLNQDAWIFNDTIASLVDKMERNLEFGIMSPVHFNADLINKDAGFATYYSRKTALVNGQGIAIVPFVNAAAWMMSRKCIERTGFFEPAFGHYGEDRNYCDRVSYHNFKIGIDDDSKIVHDRVIRRNFKKDIVQSQYKILTRIININHSLPKSYLSGLKEVAGLPMYFRKWYKAGQVIKMFSTLAGYYLKNVLGVSKILSIRKRSK